MVALRNTVLFSRRRLIFESLPGAVAAAFLSADAHALYSKEAQNLGRSDWKPVFLTDHQDQTLVRLCELIVPSGDGPGAKEALVNRFLDKLMAVQPVDTQKQFTKILSYMDEESNKRYRVTFLRASVQQQDEFLRLIAYPHTYPTWADHTVITSEGTTYFEQMKGWITGAYYSSEIGMRELGWGGGFHSGQWSGCEHEGSDHSTH